MIISDLCDEYSVLVSQNKAPAYGHDNINVPYGLVINDDGTLVAVRPLGDFSGKKPIHIISAPTRFPRSSGIVANFLCDTVTYMLGYDTKGKPERAAQAFQACAELHLCVLDGVEGPVASAICAFFTQAPQWETAQYLMGDEAWKSSLTMNFALYYDNGTQATFVGDFPNVQEAWNTYYDQEKNDNESTLVSSLVSGKQVVPEKIHPKIKGVAGAQSAGASLISFNAPAFCSHGAEQNENAPMSKREAYEYTTALNTLLADRDRVQRIGDDTVISWAHCGNGVYPDLFQLAAIPGINTTIKDKYFTSASTTPARIFPILGDLAAKHMRKTWQSKGLKIKLDKTLGALTKKVGDRYPSRLSLEERGAFQLGYYFENQKRFEKTNKNTEDAEQGENND